MAQIPLLFYYQQNRFEAELGKTGPYNHHFGASENGIIILNQSEYRFHEVVTLDLTDPAINLKIPDLTRLPLLYCFQFNDCLVEYEIINDNEVRIIDVNGFESDFNKEGPYPGYPTDFPQVPFTIGPSKKTNLNDFDTDTYQFMSEDGESEDLLCIIPENPIYGVKLWHSDPDFFQNKIKYFVDTETLQVIAKNEDYIY